jgi:hypothetical protein
MLGTGHTVEHHRAQQRFNRAEHRHGVLGAIESLLCAVVLDGMTGTKHKANSELIGQGLGRISSAMITSRAWITAATGDVAPARTFAAERAIAAVAVICRRWPPCC